MVAFSAAIVSSGNSFVSLFVAVGTHGEGGTGM